MREHMSIQMRAKQFMPFSALKGYEEAVRESERTEEERIILAEDAQQELDMKLRALRLGDNVSVLYYEGGEYRHLSGRLIKEDCIKRTLTIDEKEININDIYDIN